MDLSFELSPLIPAPLAYLLIAAAAVPLLLALFARARGALVRALALVALALALLNPVVRREDREPLSDVAVLVVDHSLSQAIGNRTKRTDDAVKKISNALSKLPQTEIRTVTVQSAEGKEQEGTRAAAALATSDLERGPRSVLVDAFGRQLTGVESDWRELLASL